MSAKRQMRPIEWTLGLHGRDSKDFPLSFIESRCAELLQKLDYAICATHEDAPLRRSSYKLTRPDGRDPNGPEAILEQRLWEEWGPKANKSPLLSPVCEFVQTYQVMLRDTNKKDRKWGEVDLLGCSSSRRPVVIELKAAASNDTPLRAMVEGAAYAIAIRKAWNTNKSGFVSQWDEATSAGPFPKALLPEFLDVCPVLCAAPEAYWKRLLGPRGKARHVPRSAWKRLCALSQALSIRGIPITFASLTYDDSDGKPRNIKASQVKIPE